MKTLRPLILCGCTADTAARCSHKSWNKGACLCPCHFTNEQTQRLISAYINVGEGHIVGFIKNLTKKTATAEQVVVVALCGHEKHFDYKPSQMTVQYVQQNRCDNCLRENE